MTVTAELSTETLLRAYRTMRTIRDFEERLHIEIANAEIPGFVHLSIGMMEQMLLASYEQAVIDNEILGAAFRIVQGVEVTRDAIGLDVIKEVGIGGNYLAHDHTVKYMRPHTWFPKITNREQWTPWMASGGKDMRQRANERARRILAEHHPKPLTDEQEREIERIALDAQKKAVAQGPYTMSGAE